MKYQTVYPDVSEAILKILESRYIQYENACPDRDLEFEIPFGLYVNLVLGRCSYCGSLPSQKSKSTKVALFLNGIDRVDSSLAYTPENSVSCCRRCNTAKGSLSVDEFLERAIERANLVCASSADFHWRNIVEFQVLIGKLKHITIKELAVKDEDRINKKKRKARTKKLERLRHKVEKANEELRQLELFEKTREVVNAL